MTLQSKKANAEFTASCGPGQHLEAIFNSVSDGILALDTQLRVTRVNRAALRITGYEEEEVLGRPCCEIVEGGLQDKGCLLSQAMEKGEDIREDRLVILTKSGEWRSCSFRSWLRWGSECSGWRFGPLWHPGKRSMLALTSEGASNDVEPRVGGNESGTSSAQG